MNSNKPALNLSLHDAVSNVSYAPVAVNLKLENAVQPDIPILMTSYGLDREPVSLANGETVLVSCSLRPQENRMTLVCDAGNRTLGRASADGSLSAVFITPRGLSCESR